MNLENHKIFPTRNNYLRYTVAYKTKCCCGEKESDKIEHLAAAEDGNLALNL